MLYVETDVLNGCDYGQAIVHAFILVKKFGHSPLAQIIVLLTTKVNGNGVQVKATSQTRI